MQLFAGLLQYRINHPVGKAVYRIIWQHFANNKLIVVVLKTHVVLQKKLVKARGPQHKTMEQNGRIGLEEICSGKLDDYRSWCLKTFFDVCDEKKYRNWLQN